METVSGKKRDTEGNVKPVNEEVKPKVVIAAVAEEEEEKDEPIAAAASASAASIPPEAAALAASAAMDVVTDARPSESLGTVGVTHYESDEFAEALASVSVDPWDVSSWNVMIEEVQAGRGGGRTFPQICQQYIAQFPRAAKAYERLADFYLKDGKADAAHALLAKGCRDCWSIDLWAYYLGLLKRKFAEYQRAQQTEEIQKQRATAEAEFQAAIERMGWSVDAFALWRVYIDFQRVYPEQSAIDMAQKTANLRKVYQRAIMMTFEQMDGVWAEFESFERVQQGDSHAQCEQYLDDWKKKFLHAKSFLRDRRRLTDRLDVDRLAVPAASGATSSSQQQEMQQLELWSSYLSYEMDNYDAANPDAYRPTVHMAFQQCLSCFLHYPEVWIAFAQFEHAQQQARDAKEQDKMLLLDRDVVAKGLLQEAIRHNPQSTILRIALAEIEESVGHLDEVLRILKDMFVAQPDGFTFTIYQRFVRRQAGLVAARKLFSETAPLRATLPAETTLELYLAHATLEWQVNNAVDVARRCLDLCREKLGQSVCLRSAAYLSLCVGVLSQLGERETLRWLLTVALEDATSSFSSLTAGGGAAATAFDAEIAQLQRQVELLELFLMSELRLNSADRAHLEYLRDRRHVTKTLLDERLAAGAGRGEREKDSKDKDKDGANSVSKLSAKLTMLMANVHGFGHPLLTGGGASGGGAAASSLAAASTASSSAAMNVRRSIFDATYELFERYDHISSVSAATAPSSSSAAAAVTQRADAELRERIRGKSALDPLHSQPAQLLHAHAQQQQGDGRGDGARSSRHGASSSGGAAGGVSDLLRDFALKLPQHVGPAPDLDAFVRHIRSVVLPPRPNGPAVGTYRASFAGGAAVHSDAAATAMDVGGGDDARDDADGAMAVDEGNDVFRQRHRAQ